MTDQTAPEEEFEGANEEGPGEYEDIWGLKDDEEFVGVDDDEPTEETTTPQQADPNAVVTIRVRGEDRTMTVEEATQFISKGIDYEEGKSEINKRARELDALESELRDRGYSPTPPPQPQLNMDEVNERFREDFDRRGIEAVMDVVRGAVNPLQEKITRLETKGRNRGDFYEEVEPAADDLQRKNPHMSWDEAFTKAKANILETKLSELMDEKKREVEVKEETAKKTTLPMGGSAGGPAAPKTELRPGDVKNMSTKDIAKTLKAMGRLNVTEREDSE